MKITQKKRREYTNTKVSFGGKSLKPWKLNIFTFSLFVLLLPVTLALFLPLVIVLTLIDFATLGVFHMRVDMTQRPMVLPNGKVLPAGKRL